VASQNDRSQHRNRAEAMAMLKSKLFEQELRKRQAEQSKLEESKTDIGWGHQIRSYVLDQSRIKDLRTGHEVGNTQAVLDGALQPLELRVRMLEPWLRLLGAEVDPLAERARRRALDALQQLHEGATRPWALESARDGTDLVAKLLVHPSGHVDGHRARSVGLEQRGERHVQR
jgi:hypothetical protein